MAVVPDQSSLLILAIAGDSGTSSLIEREGSLQMREEPWLPLEAWFFGVIWELFLSLNSESASSALSVSVCLPWAAWFLVIFSRVLLGAITAQGLTPAPRPLQPRLLGAWPMSNSSPGPAVSDKTSDTCLSRLRAAQLGDSPLRTVTGIVPKESELGDRPLCLPSQRRRRPKRNSDLEELKDQSSGNIEPSVLQRIMGSSSPRDGTHLSCVSVVEAMDDGEKMLNEHLDQRDPGPRKKEPGLKNSLVPAKHEACTVSEVLSPVGMNCNECNEDKECITNMEILTWHQHPELSSCTSQQAKQVQLQDSPYK
ncbi:uncharacterized protein LOC122683651 [Cervus elaphus]|uniref:uncharacterized protein LOC122683651 n=1 Tax=Cervus elaphus TaxID=9860 RepID=UPI001CC30591|nr:uncharacterized protein LOC122683651 [Cervus elaphus]